MKINAPTNVEFQLFDGVLTHGDDPKNTLTLRFDMRKAKDASRKKIGHVVQRYVYATLFMQEMAEIAQHYSDGILNVVEAMNRIMLVSEETAQSMNINLMNEDERDVDDGTD